MLRIAKYYYIFLIILPLPLAGEIACIQDINALIEKKEYTTALELCHTFLPDHPDDPDLHHALGTIYNAQETMHKAWHHWELALQHTPSNYSLRAKLANSYADHEQFQKALDHCAYIMNQKTHHANTLFSIAITYLKCGHIEKALALFHTLSKLTNQSFSILYNIGYTLKTAGRLDEALSFYDAALALKPDYDAAHLARGFTLLQKGDFLHGWQQHEHHLKSVKKNANSLRALLKNNALAGKRIVLLHEGGLGDTLMFIRYVQRFKQMGAHVTCIVQKPLLPLLCNHPFIDELRTTQQGYPSSFDASATLMTLPAIFYDIEDSLPRSVPYLYPREDLVAYWKTQLIPHKKLHVGLCWQSDVYNDKSRLPIARRGMPLALWNALLQVPDLAVYSLQRFDGVEQIKDLPTKCTLHVFEDMDTKNGSFVDTAALIMNLDLVISTDTAIAHLAGALGKPVLLLLPYSVDWRWIHGRTDSPWYPTMRIFKQQKPFDWQQVVNDVHTYLTKIYALSIGQ